MTWGTKVDVTTTCPQCRKEWTRETYLECAGLCGMEVCPDCLETDENGNVLITMKAEYMPTYTYQCKSCEHKFDVLQRIADPPPKCEECGKKVERIITPPAGIHFKGSGFHCNDYPKERK